MVIFFGKKYKCTIWVSMYVYFFLIFHPVLSKRYVRLLFFLNFPLCTAIKMLCTVIFFLIFHYVRLSKCYVRLFFLPRFPLCTVIWVCTFIFFPSVSTMYGYSGMYDYCFFPNSPLCTVIRVCTYIRNLIVFIETI